MKPSSNKTVDYIQKLKNFLYKASMQHATGSAHVFNEKDSSRSITFVDQEWRMHDNFFGGEPYGGRMVIFYKNKPLWMMVYYGRVTAKMFCPDELYGFLREALRRAPKNKPFRGPDRYNKAEFEYRNEVTGSINNYAGKEEILQNGRQMYWANYCGGFIDQRAKGEM